ncbi:hypothetical protein ASG36_17475 [Geodermatophilus sp. Leaf369]|uniref:hypothetical protein n=1 Tax=Geodermatophilus sp. Leaf369 TaxID=1736354 RepID=UPI0006FDEE88|nr:hypothetical protein [Geodermatophilus sp. Leaf369]KQS56818.1 hypothetical protein ASG36_17475 [Geodermatophilus sp. Leaf369]
MNRSALPTTRTRRWTAGVVGGAVAGAVLLGGGVALADGGSSTTEAPTTDAPATDAPAAGAPAPGDGPVGPGADGERPTPPADGEAPTPPADGAAPTPPADGEAPAGGPAAGGPGAEGDRLVGTVTAVSDTALTLTDDTGETHELTLTDDTRIGGGPGEEGSVADLATGDRVEVRATDGTASEVREALAHVDGVVVSVDGTDLTVVTTPGLHVDVDAAALSEVPAVGDDVHLSGTVTDDTVVATDSAVGPR